MRKIIAAAAATLIAVTAAPVMARDTAPSNSPAPAETPAPKAETRYCVSDTVVGSRIPKKTCKTRTQWIADDNFDPLAPQR